MTWTIPIEASMAIRELPDERRISVERRREHNHRMRMLSNRILLAAKAQGIPALDNPRITLKIIPQRPGRLPNFTPMTHAIIDGLLAADAIDHWTDFSASEQVHVLSEKPCDDDLLYRFHVVIEGWEKK